MKKLFRPITALILAACLSSCTPDAAAPSSDSNTPAVTGENDTAPTPVDSLNEDLIYYGSTAEYFEKDSIIVLDLTSIAAYDDIGSICLHNCMTDKDIKLPVSKNIKYRVEETGYYYINAFTVNGSLIDLSEMIIGHEYPAPDENKNAGSDISYDKEDKKMKDPILLYQGHASLRILTGDDKVIYIDPFAGDGYDMPADLILQTHDHFDHKDMSKIESRNDDCIIITQAEALKDKQYRSFDLPYVKVETVEAGYNKNHDKNNCAGYILTFENDVSLYVSGDTSKTEQMAELKSRNLDYAFFCCDGVFNMDAAEASECAELVGAKVSIPYHTASAAVTIFDENNAARFSAPGVKILTPGEELVLKK